MIAATKATVKPYRFFKNHCFMLHFSGGVYAIAAFIPISMYSGKRGFVKGNFLKTAFYLFYPLHIALLVTIKRLIIKGVI